MLLLDEPLGALDLKLRLQMQNELKDLQHRPRNDLHLRHARPGRGAQHVGSHRCHEQRVKVEQIGSPSRDVYERPQTPFVADFIGSLNTLDLRADELVGSFAMMRVGEGERLVVPTDAGVKQGDSLRIAVRPEQVQIGLPAEAEPNGGSRLDRHARTRSSISVCTRSSTSRRPWAASWPTAWPTRSCRRWRPALASRSPGTPRTPPSSKSRTATRRSNARRPTSAATTTVSEMRITTTATAITCGSWLGKRSAE